MKLEPAGMALPKLLSAVYEIQYPAQMRQDVRACRAGVQCPRRRWWKRRAKRENEADGSQASISRPWNLWKQVRRFLVPAELPAGNTLTVNPALLLDFLKRDGSAPGGLMYPARGAENTRRGNFLLIFLHCTFFCGIIFMLCRCANSGLMCHH